MPQCSAVKVAANSWFYRSIGPCMWAVFLFDLVIGRLCQPPPIIVNEGLLSGSGGQLSGKFETKYCLILIVGIRCKVGHTVIEDC